MAKVISAVNQKGGTGKTTSIIELATNLANMEKRVLTIDFDSQVGLTYYVPAKEDTNSIYDVMHGNVSVKDAIQHVNNYDVIIASENLSSADREFTDYDDVFLLKDIVDIIQDDYDYILIDTSPSRSILLTMAYIASDYIIVPNLADKGSVKGVEKVYSDLSEMRNRKRHVTNAKIVALLLNAYKSNEINDQILLEKLNTISGNIDDNPMVVTVRSYTGVKTCKSLMQSITEYDHNSTAARDFRNFAWDLVERIEGDIA